MKDLNNEIKAQPVAPEKVYDFLKVVWPDILIQKATQKI